MNSYLSHLDYLRATTGQETATLLGNSMLLNAPRAAGVSTLPLVSATAVDLNFNDPVTIFDGSNSEVVYMAAAAPAGALSISIQAPGLQFSHGQYTAMCSDGISGSLGQAIINASSEVETICKQPLLSATYTETYALQTMQASVDSIGTLNVRTTKSPVTALTSALLTTGVVSGQALSLAKVKYKGQIISIFGTNYGPAYGMNGSLCQNTEGDIDVTFTAGFVYAQLPPKIKQACIWLVSELLSDRLNPSGAAIEMQGKIHTQYRLKDEKQSSFYLRAEEALKEFSVKVY